MSRFDERPLTPPANPDSFVVTGVERDRRREILADLEALGKLSTGVEGMMLRVWKLFPHTLDSTVEAWHEGAGAGMQLHEFLGLTYEEYAELTGSGGTDVAAPVPGDGFCSHGELYNPRDPCPDPVERSTDVERNFEGHQPRDCGEHRTLGSHRAWCYDCGEYCYPRLDAACVRCELPALRERLAHAETAMERVRAALAMNERSSVRVAAALAALDGEA